MLVSLSILTLPLVVVLIDVNQLNMTFAPESEKSWKSPTGHIDVTSGKNQEVLLEAECL